MAWVWFMTTSKVLALTTTISNARTHTAYVNTMSCFLVAEGYPNGRGLGVVYNHIKGFCSDYRNVRMHTAKSTMIMLTRFLVAEGYPEAMVTYMYTCLQAFTSHSRSSMHSHTCMGDIHIERTWCFTRLFVARVGTTGFKKNKTLNHSVDTCTLVS